MTFNDLLKKANEAQEQSFDYTYKLAVLGNYATQFLTRALGAWAQLKNIDLDIYEADFDQIENEIINPTSSLYDFNPDAILISYSGRKLQSKFYDLDDSAKTEFAYEFAGKIEELTDILSDRLQSKILLTNIDELNDGVFGNYSSAVKNSFLNQARRLNVELMDLAEKKSNLYLIDVQDLLSRNGLVDSFTSSLYINADLPYSLDFTAQVAGQIVGLIHTLLGKFKKCLILDLDNTTWGGIIGDDGMDGIEVGSLGIGKAFTNLQKWAKALMQRGIILAVCSKNEESTAKEPFEKHPEMILRLEDIAVFVANWNNKADNIREIKTILNIGFDSMVFLDDNPMEREIVRKSVPEVTVPELPEDPAEYVDFLAGQNLFETVSFSGNDTSRTKQYQEESKRRSYSKKFTDVNAFLGSLNMKSKVQPITSFDVQRVSQLSQRSNQFNLRTIRYTPDDIERIMNSDKHLHFTAYLEDNFGEYGLILFAILEQTQADAYFVDSWVMSCRVANRGLEQFLFNIIADEAKAKGAKRIVGEHIPSKKNMPVKDHFKKLGFSEKDGKWELNLDSFVPLKNTIQAKQ